MRLEIKKCPFCGSEAEIRDLYDVDYWTDNDEPIKRLRFVCECTGIKCWVSPITDLFDTEEEAIEALEEKQKIGHWINEILHLPLSDGSKECVKCSECGLHYDNASHYCPNCGADMREQ